MKTFAWVGALVFVASLAYFAWSFFGSFGAMMADTGTLMPVCIDVILFSVFAVHHSLLARSGAKAVVVRIVPHAIERSAFVWIASVLFIAVCWFWQPVPGVLWNVRGVAAWILRALSIVGGLLTVQSAAMLDVFELAGTRPFMAARSDSAEIKSHGPYGFVRHPIYLAWLFLVWTPTMMNGTRLVFAAVSTLYLLIAIPFEERSLLTTLGPAYAEYQTKVRWRIVPGLY